VLFAGAGGTTILEELGEGDGLAITSWIVGSITELK
jgi:hypothetical protein